MYDARDIIAQFIDPILRDSASFHSVAFSVVLNSGSLTSTQGTSKKSEGILHQCNSKAYCFKFIKIPSDLRLPLNFLPPSCCLMDGAYFAAHSLRRAAQASRSFWNDGHIAHN